MATIRVDLTSKAASKIARANRIIDRLRLAAILGVIVFVVLVASVYGYFFFLNSRAVVVDTRVQGVVNQIQGKAETEVLYRRLADIVQETRTLIGTRRDYAGVLLDVYAIIPNQVLIEGVRFEGSSVIVDIKTQGVQEMSTVLQVLEGSLTDRFSSVALESVRRADSGNYFIRIRLVLSSATS